MKILILRFSSIGDVVLTTPVIRCLKRQTGAEIHYLTKSPYAAIVQPNPYVDRVFSFEKDVKEVLHALRRERYDWVVDLHHNLRSLRVKWALGRPSRSFDKLNLEKWLLVQTGIDCLPKMHIVDRYMKTVRHLGVHYDGEGLDYFIPPAEEVQLNRISPSLREGNYIAFVLGATHATKRLPVVKVIDICRGLSIPVVLLGGNAERADGESIATACGGAPVWNLCGQLNLHQSASVIRQAATVATNDTGLMHIAAAFRKPIVSFWGNTIPGFGMYPFYPEGMDKNTTFEVSGLSCRPCSKIGHKSCPKRHFRCMNALNSTDIRGALERTN